MYGYDNLPSTEMADTLPTQRGNVTLEREMLLKDTLVNLGMQEIITYRLTTPEREAKLLASGPADDRSYVTLANTVSADRVAMRHSLLASVAEIAAENSRHAKRISIFEVGKVYLPNEEGALPTENSRLSMIMTGERSTVSWQDADAPAEYDFYDIKGVVEDLIGSLNVMNFKIEVGEHPTFRPGRTAKLMLNDKVLGWMGELHPKVKENLDFRGDGAIMAADLDLDLLLPKVRDAVKFNPVSNYPAVQEDLAVVVDTTVSVADVAAAIDRAGGFLLKKVELFDVYEGDSIPDGKRSLAFHLAFQSPDKTLKDKDVAKLRNKIIGGLKHKLGATIRD